MDDYQPFRGAATMLGMVAALVATWLVVIALVYLIMSAV